MLSTPWCWVDTAVASKSAGSSGIDFRHTNKPDLSLGLYATLTPTRERVDSFPRWIHIQTGGEDIPCQLGEGLALLPWLCVLPAVTRVREKIQKQNFFVSRSDTFIDFLLRNLIFFFAGYSSFDLAGEGTSDELIFL